MGNNSTNNSRQISAPIFESFIELMKNKIIELLEKRRRIIELLCIFVIFSAVMNEEYFWLRVILTIIALIVYGVSNYTRGASMMEKLYQKTRAL